MQFVRRFFLLTIFLFLVGPMGAWGQLPTNQLEGTWKMVSRELVYPDSVVDQSDDWGPGFKILNSTHFAWGRETKDGSEVLAGGGWYEYHPEKNVYIEHIQYHSETAFVGQTIQFTARVEGDTWYHIGKLGDFKLREVWKRVDPKSVKQKISSMGAPSSEASSDSSQ
jgi:hypothetical protein